MGLDILRGDMRRVAAGRGIVGHILGVDVDESTGQPGAATAQFQRMCQQVASMHEFFGELDDAPGKFTLLCSLCNFRRSLEKGKTDFIYTFEADFYLFIILI